MAAARVIGDLYRRMRTRVFLEGRKPNIRDLPVTAPHRHHEFIVITTGEYATGGTAWTQLNVAWKSKPADLLSSGDKSRPTVYSPLRFLPGPWPGMSPTTALGSCHPTGVTLTGS
jgi:hypothetical protein